MRSRAELLLGLLLPVFVGQLPLGALQERPERPPQAKGLPHGTGPWLRILSSVGLDRGNALLASADAPVPACLAALDAGAVVIVEGASPVAEALGFRPTGATIPVRAIQDVHRPALEIFWERPAEAPVVETPPGAQVFTRERRTGAPLVAAVRRTRGAALWVAVPPGVAGYERFPYLVQALATLGLEPPFHSRRLWAFFDSSYRSRVDLDYFARRWRSSGIAALMVAAWHYHEPDAARDAWLRNLIAACHRNAILVYAWIEPPHVSEAFWNAHPEWREKTAILQDAHLDWRKLMNLANRECFREASRGIRELVARFDWDGVNLAELYFESPEGHSNPSRFTPMNDDVRREFRNQAGFDPLVLFKPGPPRTAADPAMRAFLDYRVALARRLQTEWIAELESLRRDIPHLDVVLTHVDDRFDTDMRDALGADAAGILPLLDTHDFTFLIEDPASIWHLGPRRYPEIARRYQPLSPHTARLGIDINIVERYQNVYPTRQQTGVELLQLVREAAQSFPRVALFFESSILPPDLAFLPAAAAVVERAEIHSNRIVVDSPRGVGVRWRGPPLVNGRPWPFYDSGRVWLPSGRYEVRSAAADAPYRLLDFNGDLKTAAVRKDGLEFRYESATRAIALVDGPPLRVEIDGAPAPAGGGAVLVLPQGQHSVRITGPQSTAATASSPARTDPSPKPSQAR